MSEAELPAHVVANRAYWDEQAPHYVANGEASWATDAPRWARSPGDRSLTDRASTIASRPGSPRAAWNRARPTRSTPAHPLH